ncbi:S8 family serine peptidase [candidate division KSB1 bacterium]|nr:S8 family serine peptidase [candidate division KSB1 bacterium]
MHIIYFIATFFLTSIALHGQTLNQHTTLSKTLEHRMASERKTAVDLAMKQNFPVRTITSDGILVELQAIDHGRPLYYVTHNAKAAETISADKIGKGGVLGYALSGSGYSLAMWEGGSAFSDHSEFEGRISIGDSDTQVTLHATHTAGTLVAAGLKEKAKGMASEASLRSFDWNKDLAEMAAEASRNMTLSNHSYGPQAGWFYDLFDDGLWVWYGDTAINAREDYQFGYYLDRARQWDNFVHQFPQYMIVASAGNDRSETGPVAGVEHWIFNGTSWQKSTAQRQIDGGADGFDSINGFALAKNILTVGAVKPLQGRTRTPADISMTRFSSWGPTDDGRIKPDIVADGLGVYSTSNESINAYAVRNGTSSATPSVTGSILLLKEHYHSLFEETALPACLLKAIVLHTADEAGDTPGPDYQFGWGLMNSGRAVDLISMDHAGGGGLFIQQHTLKSGQTIEFEIQASGEAPLKATLCWIDPAGAEMEPALNNRESVLVNDLDLRILGPDHTDYKPWGLDPDHPSQAAGSGDNDRDNVEQVLIQAPEQNTYTVRITGKGDLQDGEQALGLVLSGIISSDTEPPNAPVPKQPLDNATLEKAETQLQWQHVDNAVSYMLQISHDRDFEVLRLQENGIRSNTYPLHGLGQNLDFYWRVFAVNPAGTSSASQTRKFSTTGNAVPVTWEKITPPQLDLSVRDIIVNNLGHIIASFSAAVSFDDSAFWEQMSTYRSVDEGKTWEKINQSFYKFVINSKGIIYAFDEVRLFRIGSTGEEKTSLYLSRDSDYRGICLDDNDGIWALLNNGMIIYSSDGGMEWQEFNTLPMQGGKGTQSIEWINDKLIVSTWGKGIFCSSDSAQTWEPVGRSTCPNFVYMVKSTKDGHYLAGASSGLYRSPVEEPEWKKVGHETLGMANISTILVKDCGVIYVGNYACQSVGIGVHVSVDHGTTWIPVNSGLDHLQTDVIYESPHGELFTGINTGNPKEGGAIYRGWHEKVMETVGRELGESPPARIVLSEPADADVQHEETLTLEWQPADKVCYYQVQVSVNPDFLGFLIDRRIENNQTVMSGLLKSTQYYWRVRAINALGTGPWSETRSFTTDPTVAVSKTKMNLPEKFSLYTNYPNPFNPETTISFDIAEKSTVRITIYNLQGRSVKTLLSREVTPGTYKVVWNAHNYSSGMYIITLQAGDYKASRKCLLLK